jgi:hypothetical protein
MPRRSRSRITVMEYDYVPEVEETEDPRNIPHSGPASDWTGERTTSFEDEDEEKFVDEEEEEEIQRDFSFIRERSSDGRQRIIEHPAVANTKSREYRFCHPNAPRTRIMNATFGELKDTLNAWEPYGAESYNLCNVDFDEDEAREILQRSLLVREDIRNMVLIKASIPDASCLPPQAAYTRNLKEMHKVIIFDKSKQHFLLRGAFYKEGLMEYYPKPLKNPSQHPEWCVDLSSLLATGNFWSELKVLINSI